MHKLGTKIAVKTVVLSVLIGFFGLFVMDFKESGDVLPSVSFSQVINEYNPLDIDGDGIPNTWEETYGLDPNAISDGVFDPDNDGLTNLSEYLNNTDPTNNDTDGGSLIDGLEIQQGKNPLDPIDDIDPVEEPEEPVDENDNDNDNDEGDDDEDSSRDDANDSPSREVVKQVPQNPDLDNDRLTNEEELTVYFTNPYLQDSDYDGLSDYEEAFIFFTSPTSFDSDGGGVSDGDELANKTNPKDSTDDILYTLTAYILNDKKSTLQSSQRNKFICVSGEVFTIVFETQLPNTDIQFSINNKDIEKLVCPRAGINTLKVTFNINNKTHTITRKIESLPKGKVVIEYDGKFDKYYDYVPFYKQTLLANKTLSLDILEGGKYTPYISDTYAIEGKIQTDNKGEYFFVAIPGKYQYTYEDFSPGFLENTTQEPIIYNKTLVLTKSGDPLFVGLIAGYSIVTLALSINLLGDIMTLVRKLGKRKRISF